MQDACISPPFMTEEKKKKPVHIFQAYPWSQYSSVTNNKTSKKTKSLSIVLKSSHIKEQNAPDKSIPQPKRPTNE